MGYFTPLWLFYDDSVGLSLRNFESVHFHDYEEWIFLSLIEASKILLFSLFFFLNSLQLFKRQILNM